MCSVCVSCKALKSYYFSIYKHHVRSWWLNLSNRRYSGFLQSVFKERLMSFLSSPLPVSCVWLPVRFTSALHVSVVHLWESNLPKLTITSPLTGFIYEFSSWCITEQAFIKEKLFWTLTAASRVCLLHAHICGDPCHGRGRENVKEHPMSHYRYQNTNAKSDRLSCISKPEHTQSDSRLFVCNKNKASR